ncbi:E3 ubiquitin protein ligase DRIP2-like [Zingiber officinale]|uniref:E3 ubiquitin protein ligase DRIP2-like n=1 Tax=Zingiber officinale TaxID=94328 RepID=UPI001C4C8435|nr:E3 ubiquitin protein ligase DRIP2-like [Zingiber officinale]
MAAAAVAAVVTVKRKLLVACMTCPVCHKLIRDATTISECLHTFCRKCIYEKLTSEEVDCCPICNIELGCVPIEKLRADHNLQDLRSKIFPFKRRKIEALENFPLVTFPAKRKERSLSSLVVDTPQIAAQTALHGRRTRAAARKAATFCGQSPDIQESIKRMDDKNLDDLPENSSANPNKLNPCRKQTSSNMEPFSTTPIKHSLNGGDSFRNKTEPWKPLDCLAEVAKSFKSSPQNPVINAELISAQNGEANISQTRSHKFKVKDEKNDIIQMPLVAAKSKRLQGINGKQKGTMSSSQAPIDATSGPCDRRICPIWFQLIASLNQEGDSPLPQIPNSYLRIKDGNVPVSCIQKYLVRKLDLHSETEVGIMFRGQAVSPTTSLHKLLVQWLRVGSSQRLPTSAGTSGKEFVMVLAYSRSKVDIPA